MRALTLSNRKGNEMQTKVKTAGTVTRYDVTWGIGDGVTDTKSFGAHERARAVMFYNSLKGYEVLEFATVLVTRPRLPK